MRRTNNIEERSPPSSTGRLTCGEIGQGAQKLIRALAEAKIDECGDAEGEEAWEAAVKRAMASIPRLVVVVLPQPRAIASHKGPHLPSGGGLTTTPLEETPTGNAAAAAGTVTGKPREGRATTG